MLCVACCLAGREQHVQRRWGRALASRKRHLQHKLNSRQEELGVAWMLLLIHSPSCAKDNSGLLSKISAAIKTGQTEVRFFWKWTLYTLLQGLQAWKEYEIYIFLIALKKAQLLKNVSCLLLLSESQFIWDDDCYLSEICSLCAKPMEPVILKWQLLNSSPSMISGRIWAIFVIHQRLRRFSQMEIAWAKSWECRCVIAGSNICSSQISGDLYGWGIREEAWPNFCSGRSCLAPGWGSVYDVLLPVIVWVCSDLIVLCCICSVWIMWNQFKPKLQVFFGLTQNILWEAVVCLM